MVSNVILILAFLTPKTRNNKLITLKPRNTNLMKIKGELDTFIEGVVKDTHEYEKTTGGTLTLDLLI